MDIQLMANEIARHLGVPPCTVSFNRPLFHRYWVVKRDDFFPWVDHSRSREPQMAVYGSQFSERLFYRDAAGRSRFVYIERELEELPEDEVTFALAFTLSFSNENEKYQTHRPPSRCWLPF